MRHLYLSMLLAVSFVPGCDDDDDGDTSDSANDDSATAGGDDAHEAGHEEGDDDGDDGDDADDGADESMESCVSNHECINDVCTCTTPGKEDEACSDTDLCVDECEVCE
ncbi:MAG: hypothetical protein JKY37_26850 [Nannocystaceae bacterium]|nr:hypothetical protein [Nannocystaceae bacterium]